MEHMTMDELRKIRFPKFRFPIFYEKGDKPNYKVIELQAENGKLKDELIEMLKSRVAELEYELKMSHHNLMSVVKGGEIRGPDPNERDVGSHMVAPTSKPRVRTMSEVAMLLEKRSLNAVSLKEEPGDKNDKV